VDLAQHVAASKLPTKTPGPSLHDGLDSLRSLGIKVGAADEKLPQTLDDYLYTDDPPLRLHVVNFKDATFVSINFPHAVTDAMGLSELISNWCKVLAGKQDQVHPLATDDHPMESLSSKTTTPDDDADEEEEKHLLTPHILSGLALILFGLNFLYDILLGPKMQTRILFLPSRAVERLRRRAMLDILPLQPSSSSSSTPHEQHEHKPGPSSPSASPSDPLHHHHSGKELKQGVPFISEGDVLTAWITKQIASSFPPPPSSPIIRMCCTRKKPRRSLAVMSTFDLRTRMPYLFRRVKVPGKSSCTSSTHHPKATVQNAILASFTFFSAQEAAAAASNNNVNSSSSPKEEENREEEEEGGAGGAGEPSSLPLGKMALRFREDLTRQTTPAQIRAHARLQREALTRTGRPVIFAPHNNGNGNAVLLPFTNWTKAGFYDVVDFGPAVVAGSTCIVSSSGEEANKRGGGGGQEDVNGERFGRPVMFWAFDANPESSPMHRNAFNILGKDPEGNYWMTGILSGAAWERILKEACQGT